MSVFVAKSWTEGIKCTVVRATRSICMLFQKNKKKTKPNMIKHSN